MGCRLTENEMCLRVDMRRALLRLNSLERQVVVLISLGDLSIREAARMVTMSRTGCHRLYGLALEKLRRHLACYLGLLGGF